MDTSETYIKQSDCPEIQDIKHKGSKHHFYLEYGDYTFWGGVMIICSQKYDLVFGKADKVTWLPRQDQLQEMVIPEDEKDCLNKYIVLLDDFQDWVLNDCTGLEWAHLHAVTMEQLWLAFVMKEKFNKTWNGDKWV